MESPGNNGIVDSDANDISAVSEPLMMGNKKELTATTADTTMPDTISGGEEKLPEGKEKVQEDGPDKDMDGDKAENDILEPVAVVSTGENANEDKENVENTGKGRVERTTEEEKKVENTPKAFNNNKKKMKKPMPGNAGNAVASISKGKKKVSGIASGGTGGKKGVNEKTKEDSGNAIVVSSEGEKKVENEKDKEKVGNNKSQGDAGNVVAVSSEGENKVEKKGNENVGNNTTQGDACNVVAVSYEGEKKVEKEKDNENVENNTKAKRKKQVKKGGKRNAVPGNAGNIVAASSGCENKVEKGNENVGNNTTQGDAGNVVAVSYEGEKKVEKEKDNENVETNTKKAKRKKQVKKRRKKNTVPGDAGNAVADKPKTSTAGKGSEREKFAGMIFMCNLKTKQDCYNYKVLGLPPSKKELVEKIYEGMTLFLYDTDLKLLYGIYKAAGPGGYNIEHKAFRSAFPSQVRFTILDDCLPLPEDKFKEAIKDNYYGRNKFGSELTSQQVEKLCKLFHVTTNRSKVKQGSRVDREEPTSSEGRGKKRKRSHDIGRRSKLHESRFSRRQIDVHEREAYATTEGSKAKRGRRVGRAEPPTSVRERKRKRSRERVTHTRFHEDRLPRSHTDVYSRLHEDRFPRSHTDVYGREAYAWVPLPPPMLPREAYALPPPSYVYEQPLDMSYYKRDSELGMGVHERPLEVTYYRADPQLELRDHRVPHVELRQQNVVEYQDPYSLHQNRLPYGDSLYRTHSSPGYHRSHRY